MSFVSVHMARIAGASFNPSVYRLGLTAFFATSNISKAFADSDPVAQNSKWTFRFFQSGWFLMALKAVVHGKSHRGW